MYPALALTRQGRRFEFVNAHEKEFRLIERHALIRPEPYTVFRYSPALLNTGVIGFRFLEGSHVAEDRPVGVRVKMAKQYQKW